MPASMSVNHELLVIDLDTDRPLDGGSAAGAGRSGHRGVSARMSADLRQFGRTRKKMRGAGTEWHCWPIFKQDSWLRGLDKDNSDGNRVYNAREPGAIRSGVGWGFGAHSGSEALGRVCLGQPVRAGHLLSQPGGLPLRFDFHPRQQIRARLGTWLCQQLLLLRSPLDRPRFTTTWPVTHLLLA